MSTNKNKRYNKNKFTSVTRKLSSYLRSLANRRSTGIVTADDANNYLQREGVRQSQVGTRLSLINTVLREPMFSNEGTTVSARPAAKYRRISAWTTA